MCFYWESIHKQIRIVGKGSVVSDEISDKYFGSRPRGSQIGAWASDQSSLIKSFSYLKQREKKFEKKFEGFNVPRPDYWVGIKIEPKQFEFWQQGDFRLHRREVYFLKKTFGKVNCFHHKLGCWYNSRSIAWSYIGCTGSYSFFFKGNGH